MTKTEKAFANVVALNQYVLGKSLTDIEKEIPGVFEGIDLKNVVEVLPKPRFMCLDDKDVVNSLMTLCNALRAPTYLDFEYNGNIVALDTFVHFIRQNQANPEVVAKFVTANLIPNKVSNGQPKVVDTLIRLPEECMQMCDDLLVSAFNIRCYGDLEFNEDVVKVFDALQDIVECKNPKAYDDNWLQNALLTCSKYKEYVLGVSKWALVVPNMLPIYQLTGVPAQFEDADGQRVRVYIRRGNVGKLVCAYVPTDFVNSVCSDNLKRLAHLEVRGGKMYFEGEAIG